MPTLFVRALSPVEGFGAGTPLNSILYRGHRDSGWRLVPKAHRKTVAGGDNSWKGMLSSEANNLLRFVELANRHGLYVPDQMKVRDLLRRYGEGFEKEDDQCYRQWAEREVFSAMALAQHSGLATSLLDFTWSPYVAAYFAAHDALNDSYLQSQEQHLCVWVVYDATHALAFNHPNHMTLISAPAFGNHNLQAQEGAFLWTPVPADDGWSCLNEVAAMPLEDILQKDPLNCRLAKLNMSWTEALPLFQSLIRIGFDNARLFPGYAGVAKALGEHERAGLMHVFP